MNMNGQTRWMGSKTEYPLWGILAVMGLVLISPFVSPYLCYFAFVISICRMLRFDAKVFAVDYAILIPVCQFYRTTGGMSLLVWLCLVAAIWFFVRGKIKVNSALVAIILLLNYLLLRMQMNISNFVLCFGQMFMLYVVLPKQSEKSADQAVKAFCWSLLITTIYALIFRSNISVVAIRGEEDLAIWGTSIGRFSGLIKDPNYYMTLLLVGMASLCKMKETNHIGSLRFWTLIISFTIFGILTYSKTFFLLFFLLGGIYVVWQFWSRRAFKSLVFACMALIVFAYLLLSGNSPFAVVIARLTSGSTLDDITTGRTYLFAQYWAAVTEGPLRLLFGFGLNASGFEKGAHNLYLEILYYVGIVGLLLFVGLLCFVVSSAVEKNYQYKKQSVLAKYIVLFIMALQYCALQGMFQIVTYAGMFMAMLSVLLLPRKSGEPETQRNKHIVRMSD